MRALRHITDFRKACLLIGKISHDVTITKEEIGGLMADLLYTDSQSKLLEHPYQSAEYNRKYDCS